MTLSRRSAVLAAGLVPLAVLSGCGPMNPERLRQSDSGFTDVDQSPVVARGPVATNLPSSPVIDRILSRGALRYAGSSTLPGFSQINPVTGKRVGFDAGIGELFARYLLGEASIDFSESTADTREALLQNQSVDAVVSTYSITKNREEVVNFAGPYLTVTSGVAVPAGTTDITRSADLSGREVAVQPGAAEEALLNEVPDAIPIRFEQSSQCFAAVQQQRVDAWVANTAILTSLVSTDSRSVLTDIRFGQSRFGIGLSKDDPTVREVANEFIREIATSGIWQELWDATAGRVDPVAAPEPPTDI